MPNEMLREGFVRSEIKPPGRKVWELAPEIRQTGWVALFLDAELYIDKVLALDVLNRLEELKVVPALAAVFVSSDSAAARHSDYVCDPAYLKFLAQDVIPWAAERNPGRHWKKTVIVGLSLSGLAAAHAAIERPDRFRVAVCQSPSLWWSNEQFRAALPSADVRSAKFWVSVGDGETSSNVSHPPTALRQEVSQLDACSRGAEALKAAGYSVIYREFAGGHKPECWTDDLLRALQWAGSA